MRTLVVVLILFSPDPLAIAVRREWFVVWNVGQGLWTTRVGAADCDHFDVGGEFLPFNEVARLCANRTNRLHFSHGDWDHVGGTPRLRRLRGGLCLAARPGGRMTAKKSGHLFGELAECARSPLTLEIRWPIRRRDSNASSRVFVREGVLLPGDSPSGEELSWSGRLPGAIRLLVLGHHGSRTSTGEALLRRLPGVRMAVASARKRRYGHPHAVVAARLRRHGIALLRTEDWGHLIFEMTARNPIP